VGLVVEETPAGVRWQPIVRWNGGTLSAWGSRSTDRVMTAELPLRKPTPVRFVHLMQAASLVAVGLVGLLACTLNVPRDKAAVNKEPVPVAGRIPTPPKLVAILPFETRLEHRKAGEEPVPELSIRASLRNRLAAHRYPVQRVSITGRLFQDKGLTTPDTIVALPVATLREITKADAVVYGQIVQYDRHAADGKVRLTIGATVRMVDLRTSETLWETNAITHVHDMKSDADPFAAELPRLLSDPQLRRKIETAYAADALWQDVLRTLPALDAGSAGALPAIRIVATDAADQPLKVGESLAVVMEGEPGRSATFDLGEGRTGLAMEEKRPGLYVGTYLVKPGDNVDKAVVVGRLSASQGAQAEAEDPTALVMLDAIPPSVPVGLTAMGRDQAVSLRWKANGENDLASYKIYRGATALGSFELLATSDSPLYLDSGIQNRQSYFYRIAAVDRFGNESAPSGSVLGIPVKPGPTPVSGAITQATTWYAGAGPYVLTGDVTVAPGATLTIESGTVIQSNGGGLIVQGTLQAKGLADDEMVVFAPMKQQPEPSWQGIVFSQGSAQESLLERVRISGASVGVSVLSASPVVRASEITGNQVGVLVRHAGAKPVFDGNRIVANLEDGIVVQEAAAPVITGNRITHNRRYGVALHKTPGLAIRGNEILENGLLQGWNAGHADAVDLSGNWWGTTEGAMVLTKVDGAVLLNTYLDGPLPNGQTVTLPALHHELGGTLTSPAFLLAVNSPYLLTRPLIIDKGATLTIQAGVVVRYKAGENSLVVRNGTIQAMGTAARPITLTSAGASPRPGDYASAVRFEGAGPLPSFLMHVRIEYASTAIQVKEGNPEIAHAYIAHNLQSALECTGRSSPKIAYSTLTEHPNNAAVLCGERAQATLYHNNIVKNAWGVINHSALPVRARENWWGVPQPDGKSFIGAVEYTPPLKGPEPEATGK